jgi:hypothetical protein
MDPEQISSDASEPKGREKGSVHDDEQEEKNPAADHDPRSIRRAVEIDERRSG